MALIVEDGTGIEDADSYNSIAAIDAYAISFGYTKWAALNTSQKEINARKAAQFLDSKYPMPGHSLKSDQGLHFPASCVYIAGSLVSGIPKRVKNAHCELAIACIDTDLVESVIARNYTYRKVKVGDVEKTEKYDTDDTEKRFGTAEMLLRPLLTDFVAKGFTTSRLIRA